MDTLDKLHTRRSSKSSQDLIVPYTERPSVPEEESKKGKKEGGRKGKRKRRKKGNKKGKEEKKGRKVERKKES